MAGGKKSPAASGGVEDGQNQQGIPWQEETVGQGPLNREQGGAGKEVDGDADLYPQRYL